MSERTTEELEALIAEQCKSGPTDAEVLALEKAAIEQRLRASGVWPYDKPAPDNVVEFPTTKPTDSVHEESDK
jgi:hypothetical protein